MTGLLQKQIQIGRCGIISNRPSDVVFHIVGKFLSGSNRDLASSRIEETIQARSRVIRAITADNLRAETCLQRAD